MKNELTINLNHLERACQKQPQLLQKWGSNKAELTKKRKNKENELKIKKAEKCREIRRNPRAFGLDKVTEKALDDICLLDLTIQKIIRDLHELEYEEDMSDIMVKSLQDRRTQLENLVKLHGQMYWSKPNVNKPMSTVERRKNE